MISEILLGLILIVLIFIAVMIWAIGEKISEK
jgi:Na+-transporting methylmalonyl-CoA/oxaloacetate decarboxylase gamma subunit